MAVLNRITPEELDRNLALLAYGLLFFAIFLGGLPALAAVAIAYSRKNTAGPLIRSHHKFQIWVFWIGFGMALLAAASGMATIISALIQVVGGDQGMFDGWMDFQARLAGSNSVAAFLVSTLVLFAATGLWLAACSAYGFIQLASSRAMSKTPSV